MQASTLIFFVNGSKIVEESPDPEQSLLVYLRQKLQLCGTKNACSEGGCGACTVMVSKYDHHAAKIRHISVNACLLPVCSLHGCAVITVEGIGPNKNFKERSLHPIQERLAQGHGTQCGFCSPGFVMAMYSLLRSNPEPTAEEIESHLQGNLCRCTGYRPIIQSFYSFAKETKANDERNGCCNGIPDRDGVRHCPCKVTSFDDGTQEALPQTVQLDHAKLTPYDPSQEIIFPPELQLDNSKLDQQSLEFVGPKSVWRRPINLNDLILMKRRHPDSEFVVGHTALSIEKKECNLVFPNLICTTSVPELRRTEITPDGIRFGAAVTYTELENFIKDKSTSIDAKKTRSLQAIADMLQMFEFKHIKNVASWSGSVAMGNPTSDISPVLLAAGASLQVVSAETAKERTIPINENFFISQRKTALTLSDVIVSAFVPFSSENDHFGVFKQGRGWQRVTAAFRITFSDKNENVISQFSLAFAGVGRRPLLFTNRSKPFEGLQGREWNDDFIAEANPVLGSQLRASVSNDSKSSPAKFSSVLFDASSNDKADSIQALCLAFFYKFYVKVRIDLEYAQPKLYEGKSLLSSQRSAWQRKQEHQPISAVHVLNEVLQTQPEHDAVGRALMHQSAAKHATGLAIYCDDVPIAGLRHLALVRSTKAHAKIISIDASVALAMPGVIALIDASDIPPNGANRLGIYVDDEAIFASNEVIHEGQLICGIVAETAPLARAAAKLVAITYEELPAILTISDAKAANSWLYNTLFIKQGDVEAAFEKADHCLEGTVAIGAQEHFYMETHGSICIPREEEIEAITSSQGTDIPQILLSRALGIAQHKVTVKVKRLDLEIELQRLTLRLWCLGGAFGGKELSCGISLLPAAIAAWKLGVPVKCVLQRDEDMMCSGTRHPFEATYKVGFMDDGTITAIKIEMFGNGGCSLNASRDVGKVAMSSLDGSYKVANYDLSVHMAKTNLPSNTSFRGFGRPQAIVIREQITARVAMFLRMDPVKIREMSLYAKDGDRTPYGQLLEDCSVRRCWNECLEKSEYYIRRRKADVQNSRHRWIKRGITVVPLKYGIGFPLFMNQAAATVHIYTDGSVLINTGAAEVGQGLYTKLMQIATRSLGVPIDLIHINDTTSDKIPNATQTAGSSGADLYGGAVKLACEELRGRLEPYIAKSSEGTWQQWIKNAYWDRVNLSCTGFFKTEPIDPNEYEDNVDGTGKEVSYQYRHRYYTYGAACVEVEIDCLTGSHKVLRVDIVMDIGQTLNPALDIGQIEGALIQGYGFCTMEDHKYSKDGHLLTKGPGGYMIPYLETIPRKFNVYLLKGSQAPQNIYSSKGVGEPPLVLGPTVFFAIQDAILSARCDAGLTSLYQFDCPATAERIRAACGSDDFEAEV